MLSDISVATINGDNTGGGTTTPTISIPTLVVQDPVLVSAQPNTVLCSDGFQDAMDSISPCVGHGGVATTTVATPINAIPIQETQPIVQPTTPQPIVIPQPMPVVEAPAPAPEVPAPTPSTPAPTPTPTPTPAPAPTPAPITMPVEPILATATVQPDTGNAPLPAAATTAKPINNLNPLLIGLGIVAVLLIAGKLMKKD